METQQRDMRAAAANARAARTLSKQKRWAEEMRADGWTVLEPGTPRRGLCADRGEHEAHDHVSDSLGRFWCTADQDEREPWRSERARMGR